MLWNIKGSCGNVHLPVFLWDYNITIMLLSLQFPHLKTLFIPFISHLKINIFTYIEQPFFNVVRFYQWFFGHSKKHIQMEKKTIHGVLLKLPIKTFNSFIYYYQMTTGPESSYAITTIIYKPLVYLPL